MNLTQVELNNLQEAIRTWLVLLANDQDGYFSEAIDITLTAGEILRLEQKEMEELLAKG